MAETVQQLLRERAEDDGADRVGLKYGDRTWTWREHLAEAAAEASVLVASHDPARPLHVGTLLGNTPEMLRAMAAAGLGGYVLCGHQHHPPRRRAARRRTPRGLPVPAHRRGAPAAARGARPRRRHGDRRDRAGLGRAAGEGRPADAVPRGRRDGHADDDLHLGHQRRPEGRPGGAPDGAVLGAEPGRAVLGHRRRRLLHRDAAVPLQRRGRRLGGRACGRARRWCRRGSRRPGSSPTCAATARRT